MYSSMSFGLELTCNPQRPNLARVMRLCAIMQTAFGIICVYGYIGLAVVSLFGCVFPRTFVMYMHACIYLCLSMLVSLFLKECAYALV